MQRVVCVPVVNSAVNFGRLAASQRRDVKAEKTVCIWRDDVIEMVINKIARIPSSGPSVARLVECSSPAIPMKYVPNLQLRQAAFTQNQQIFKLRNLSWREKGCRTAVSRKLFLNNWVCKITLSHFRLHHHAAVAIPSATKNDWYWLAGLQCRLRLLYIRVASCRLSLQFADT